MKILREKPSYDVFDLVVEVGSALGLWIGLSILGNSFVNPLLPGIFLSPPPPAPSKRYDVFNLMLKVGSALGLWIGLSILGNSFVNPLLTGIFPPPLPKAIMFSI